MKKALISCLLLLFSLTLLAQEKIPLIDFDSISKSALNYSKSDDYENVVKELSKISKNDSTYCNVLISKSYYLLNSKKYNEAIEATNEGLAQNCYSSHLSFYVNKGLAHVYLEKYEDALTIYNEGIEIYPKNYLLWYNKGVVLEKLERKNEAVIAYQNAITFNPLYARPHLQLGNLCYKQDRISQALMCFNIYLLLSIEEDAAYNTLNSLNNLVAERNESVVNPDFKISPDDDSFDEMDLILNNKIALNKNYNTGNKININLINQNHALIQQLKDYKGNGGFWDKKYVPFYKWILENNLFDNFSYTLCYPIENEKYKKLIAQKNKEIVAFMDLFYEKWEDILSINTIEFEGKTQEVSYSYSDTYVEAIGALNGEEPIGNWKFFNNNGQKFSIGSFDDKGERAKNWTWFHTNGKIKETAIYEKGKLNGENFQFYENEKPSVIANYKDGELDGEFLYYNDKGALFQKKYFKNGELDGLYKSYFDVGEELLEFDIPYKNGLIDSKTTEYYSSGNVFSEIEFKDGKRNGLEKKYFWNDKVSSEINYVNGELNGSYKTYHSNGNVFEIGQSLDNFYNGEWQQFYKDGTIQSQFTYDKGYLNNDYKFYDTDGKLYYQYLYKKGEVIEYKYFNKQGEILKEGRKKGGEFQFTGYSPEGNVTSEGLYNIKGGKDGFWQFYSSNGVLTGKGNYTEDKVVGDYITYYNNGEIESKSVYKNDLLNGYYQGFHLNGQLKKQGWYKDNAAHGEWRTYYINGTLEEINFYHKGKLHGIQESFSCDGKPESVYTYKYGELTSETYYDATGNTLGTINYTPKENKFTVVYNYTNKKPNLQIEYVNGVKHGSYTYSDFYGKKRTEGHYKNGSQNGKWVWYYPSGKIETVRNYLNGYLNGESFDYFEDGTIQNKRIYENGKSEGKWISYYENGKKSYETDYYNDTVHGEKIFYDHLGNLQLVRIYNNNRLTGYTYLDKDSKRLPVIPIVNETATIVSYYNNGTIAREMEYKNGDIVNNYNAYYYDGKLENNIFFKANEYDGVEKEYYPNGKLKKEINYQFGVLQGFTKTFYENGNIKQETTYLNNTKNGETNHYNQTGKLVKKEYYFDGNIYKSETF